LKDRYWNNLITSLRTGQCILILGPEIPAYKSEQADDIYISYSDALKDQLASELADEGYSGNIATNLAGVAQQYEDATNFGLEMLKTQSAQFYTASQIEPSAIHHEIAAFPFSFVLSTCHDQLLELAFKAAGKSPLTGLYNLNGDRRENPEITEFGSINTPFIYYLFGHYEKPQSLVLSENNLLEFLIAVISENPPIPNSIRKLLQHNGTSFLFVGFGIRHWYLRVLLKVLIKSLSIGGRTGGSSVAVEPLLQAMPEFERQQTILFYQRGSARIEICAEDIHSFLVELDHRLKAAGGVSVQATSATGSCPHVFISYAREDQSLAERLFLSLKKANFEPWLDRKALQGGDDWNEMIEEHLRETDYVLVLQTKALAEKTIGYVNKEIAIACDQALRYRSGLSFLIPLVVDNLPSDERIKELAPYQYQPLRNDSYEEDVDNIIKTLRRDYQRRQRQ
jgi:hypothetical protein